MVDRITFRNSAAVLVNSKAVKGFLIGRYGLTGDQISVVHNGLNLSRFQPPADRERFKEALGFPADCVLVGGIGRLESVKRFGLFIDLAVSLQDELPHLCFLVVGEGSLREYLETRIRKAGLGTRFRILPPREDVGELFGAMDIYLLTSFREGLPNVVMEAMAMELPCIATDAGGTGELVQEGRSGYIVPLGREPEIPGLLKRLVQDSELRHEMGRAGRKQIEDHFSTEAMVEAMVGVYAEVLKKKDPVN